MENHKNKSFYVKKDDYGKVDHLRVKDYSKNQVYTPISERKTGSKILEEVLEEIFMEEKKKVDVYNIYGFLNPSDRIPDFGNIVYSFNNKLYLEIHDGNNGYVEQFIPINEAEIEKTIRFDGFKIYNAQFLDDSYIGKDATDLLILNEDTLYVDRVSNFKISIGSTYRLATPSILAKVLVKK